MHKAMDDNAASPIPLLGTLIVKIILDLVSIALQDFPSSFNCIFHTFLDLLSNLKKAWAESKNMGAKILYILTRKVEMLPAEKVKGRTKNTGAAEFFTQKLCSGQNINNAEDDANVSRGEVKMVMEKLGVCYNPDGDMLQERLGSDDIGVLFEGQGARLEEVKEAFELFDENSDGFIDAAELKKIVSALGVMMVSEVECQKMIRAFDEDGDGVVDFNEFVKLLEKSFC